MRRGKSWAELGRDEKDIAMLYVYFGNDATVVRQKAFVFLESLGDVGGQVTRISSDGYVPGMLTELTQGTSLFGGSEVVVLDTLSEDVEVFAEVVQHLDAMGQSANHFVLIEGPLNAAIKKACTTCAKQIDEVKVEKKEKFNAFALTDAFLRRDKKSLWLLLMAAWKEGLSNEEIIGVLFWQIKTLRLVERTGSAEESGQKPFVYQKAKRALSGFKKGELDTFSQSLLRIYHDGHMGKVDIPLALEKWVLTI